MSVLVVIEEGGTRGKAPSRYSCFVSDLAESAVALVVIELVAPVIRDVEVRVSVIVVIAHGHTQPVAGSLHSRFRGHVFEAPLADVAVQPIPESRLGFIDARVIVRHFPKRRSVHQENVQQAIGIVVEKRTASGHCLDEIALLGGRMVQQEVDARCFHAISKEGKVLGS